MNNPSPEPNGRILLVDDNRSIHADFLKILCRPDSPADTESMESSLFGDPAEERQSVAFEVDSAYQGQEALDFVKNALAERHPYAMAFMDVRMPPGWDGVETTAKIWEIDPDIQIVICTAYSDYSWDEMIQKLGHSDKLLILKKPFDNVEVLQLASALTAKWRLLQHVRRQVGQLEEMVRQRTGELSRSERHYRLIAENTGDLIEIIDASGRPLYRSPSCGRLFAQPSAGPGETGVLDVIHPDDRDVAAAAMRACLHDGKRQSFDFRARGGNGDWLALEAHCGPFRDDRAEAGAVLLVSRDVTERRKLELHLRQAQKLESIGQLATGIAHEINTPTQFIGDNTHFLRTAFADLLDLLARHGELLAAAESGPVPADLLAAVRNARAAANPDYLAAEIPRAFEDMLNGIARTAKIVKAMRNFAHPGMTNKTSVNLAEIAEDALTITRNEWRYVADAVIEFEPSLPPVPVFPGEFSQVLLNLIINAAHTITDRVGDGSRGKGTITLGARRDGDWVELRVRDTGMGIPVKVQDRVYDPFFTTKPMGKGTGQGLALARSIIVNQHGGSLVFETVQGEGTVFIIRLPIHPASEISPPSTEVPSP